MQTEVAIVVRDPRQVPERRLHPGEVLEYLYPLFLGRFVVRVQLHSAKIRQRSGVVLSLNLIRFIQRSSHLPSILRSLVITKPTPGLSAFK